MGRREANTSRSKKRQVLSRIKQLRDGNQGALNEIQVEEDSIYREVSEQEYADIVRKRREETPFVEDDDGNMGYYDDGEEQFFDAEPDEHEQFDTTQPEKMPKGKGALSSGYARRAKLKQRMKLGNKDTRKVTSMFFKPAGSKSTNPFAKSNNSLPKRKRADIDLDGMLDDLSANPLDDRQRSARSRFKKPFKYSTYRPIPNASDYIPSLSPTSQSSSSYVKRMREIDDTSLDYHQEEENGLDMDFDVGGNTAMEVDMEREASSDKAAEIVVPKANAEECKEGQPATEKEGIQESPKKPKLSKRAQLFQKARDQTRQISTATQQAIESITKAPESEDDDENDITRIQVDLPSNEVPEWWNQQKDEDSPDHLDQDAAMLEIQSSTTDKATSIKMFWTDAVEIRERPGKLYLMGKMADEKRAGKFKSVCVTVNNLYRYLYVVPKLPPNSSVSSVLDLNEEERRELWMNMHEELEGILVPRYISGNHAGSESFTTKLVERSYAFELADMPRGKSLYLKLKYLAKYEAPSAKYCEQGGRTFSRICGSDTPATESFLIHQKLMGPGWLEIANVVPSGSGLSPTSYCKAEYTTIGPKNVRPIQGIPSPTLTVVSLALKTYCNPLNQQHEIVALSMIVQEQVNCEGQTNTRAKFSHLTLVRPLDNHTFPPSYAAAIARDDRFGAANGANFRMELNERALLTFFLTRIQRHDPDVIVGHNIHQYEMNVLLSRMDHYRLGGQWSKLTRLRRGRLNPYKKGEGWNEYRMDDVGNGRLIVDTYLSAKEYLTSQPNYSLSFLVQSLLKKQRQDLDYSAIPYFLHEAGPDAFVHFCRHTTDDALFVLHLMYHLEVLPLSKQLAGLCGYFWSRTLESNKRSERNEYLLLHEFNRSKQKYVVPDKFSFKKGGKASNKKKDPSYSGGMVFAPKKGLYDNFVVLLDFNSLYPSIIREYNICFTSVDRTLQSSSGEKPEAGANDEIPELPSGSAPVGVLPEVIKRLLESRKQVKGELKKELANGNDEKAKRLDIRQKAIKLTANSIYGCLGFRNSRFYAKAIAALITSTGRTTLQRAQEVAENECGYDVIYGDTDSIMVDSRTTNLAEAKRIGMEIQAKCNKKFKLLELEMESVFQRILLLNKKKYAAIIITENPKSKKIETHEEIKGLDMVRRDWCILSKVVGHEILRYILSGNPREEVVESIHDYLMKLNDRVRKNEESLDKFVITKSLTKSPEQYPDASKQYHVQVALAMKAQGQPIGAGSHIAYVMCKEVDPVSGRRAYHPDEYERDQEHLHLDIEWYLEAQIHPPINRLCAHIEGTSSSQLAHCLGLDTSKFTHHKLGTADDEAEIDRIPSVLQSDAERFQHCRPLILRCNKCSSESKFDGIFPENISNGLYCPNLDCQAEYWGFEKPGINDQVGDNFQAYLLNRLQLLVRACVNKYYLGYVICTDTTCKNRTQQQSLKDRSGTKCLAVGCSGKVRYEYPDHELFTQLKYLQSLFDIQRTIELHEKAQAQETDTKASMRTLPQLSSRHDQIFEAFYAHMSQVIQRNEYNWVRPSVWTTMFGVGRTA